MPRRGRKERIRIRISFGRLRSWVPAFMLKMEVVEGQIGFLWTLDEVLYSCVMPSTRLYISTGAEGPEHVLER
jgi:hypothetical protein